MYAKHYTLQLYAENPKVRLKGVFLFRRKNVNVFVGKQNRTKANKNVCRVFQP